MTLLTAVERCLRNQNISATRFGQIVASDPRFVFDLRRGRQPRQRTEQRVLACIASGVATGTTNSTVAS